MRLSNPERTDIAVGAMEQIEVTIAANAVSFMASTVGLATDKIGYPIREISSNAWDAAGGDFTVHLPTKHDPVFRVRDYGPGLDHGAMSGRYAVLYESDKRQDDTKVGSWGAGRFSPFAYLMTSEGCAPYSVTSYTGGHARTYVISLNKTGTPVIRLIADEPSDERTGLEVAWAVRADDIAAYHTKAKQILWGFSPRPAVTPEIIWPTDTVQMSGSDWTLYQEGSVLFSGPHVRMGCAVYPIDARQIEDNSMISGVEPMLFEAPIGSLSPTLSRENLAYDDRTKATLTRLAHVYKDEFVSSVKAQVEAAPSYFAACKVFSDLTVTHHRLRKVARDEIRWRGHEIHEYINISGMTLPDNWTADRVERFASMSGIRTSQCVGLPIVIEHNPSHSLRKLAIAGLAGRKLLWIRCKRVERDERLAWLGNPDGVITLDDYRIENDRSRPTTVRRRRTMEIDAHGRITQTTKEIDLAHNLVVVQASNDRHHNYVRFRANRPLPLRDFQGLMQDLRALGALPQAMTLLVKTDNESMKEGWSWFCDWVTASLTPIAAEYRPTGYEGVQLSSLGRRVQALSAIPENLLIGMHPEIVGMIREAMRLRTAITGGVDRTTPAYRANEILRKLGTAPTISASTNNPIEGLSERISAFELLHPAFAAIMSSLGNYHSFYSRGQDHYGAIVEYARLLTHAPSVERQQEAA